MKSTKRLVMRMVSYPVGIAVGILLAATQAGAQTCRFPAIPNDAVRIDARLNQPNPVAGRTQFKRSAKIAIINMNPFIYKYKIETKQTEIKETAQIGFFKLLSPIFGDLASNITFESVKSDSVRGVGAATSKLNHLITLVCNPGPRGGAVIAPCRVVPAISMTDCADNSKEAGEFLQTLGELTAQTLHLKGVIEAEFAKLEPTYLPVRREYETVVPDGLRASVKEILWDDLTESAQLCAAVNHLNSKLVSYPTVPQLIELKGKIKQLHNLAEEIRSNAQDFQNDQKYTGCQARIRGMRYINNLTRLIDVISGDLYDAYLDKVEAMLAETQNYDFLRKAFARLSSTGGDALLQQIFDVVGRYEISVVDIAVIPEKIKKNDTKSAEQVRAEIARVGAGNPESSEIRTSVQERERARASGRDSQAEAGGISVNDASVTRLETPFAVAENVANTAATQSGTGSNEETTQRSPAPTAKVQIGNRRFEISGGFAYTSLEKIEFQPVLGFARDADGNLTNGQTLTKVVGFKEESGNRISPIVMLNTRLTNFRKNNLFFSFGVTGKKDNQGTDIEYLLGPSFNFLGKNLFLTVGGYAGKQQVLGGDLFLNAKLPDGVTELPVRKEFHWKPGFSLTYRFPIKIPETGAR